jgi:hypothetical protein
MKNNLNAIISVAFAATLTACGGGGDGDEVTKASPYTKLDAVNSATLGVLTTTLTGEHVGLAIYYFSEVLRIFSSDTIGTHSFPGEPCDDTAAGSGTYSVNVSKDAVRTGFAAGDKIIYTFSKCKYSGLVLDGTFKLTAQGSVVNLDSTAYSVDYLADMTGFSLTYDAVTTRLYGTAHATYSRTANHVETLGFTVPANQTLTAAVTTSRGDFVMAYGTGTTFAGTEAFSANAASRKLDGSLNVQTQSAGAVPSQVSTPTALAGTTTSGKFVATSGVINVKSADLSTSTTFSGVAAKVSADTDRNGSLDLVFDSNWTELTTR